MDAIDSRDMNEVNRIMREYRSCEHHRLSSLGEHLQTGILESSDIVKHSTDDFKFTNAFTECTNNLCKVAKR